MNARIVISVATTWFRSARPRSTIDGGISAGMLKSGFIVILVMVRWEMILRSKSLSRGTQVNPEPDDIWTRWLLCLWKGGRDVETKQIVSSTSTLEQRKAVKHQNNTSA